jgi:NhaP-type Na+/H+ or K+/H+ antiporter
VDVFKKFVVLAGGGAVFGILFGIIASLILTKIFNNFVLEVNTTIVVCYVMFYFAEFTTLGFSGILSLVAFGLYMTYSGKTKISIESQHALHHVWGYIGFAAETLIFILSGVIIGDRFLGGAVTEPTNDPVDNSAHENEQLSLHTLSKVFAAYIMLHFIRFFGIMLFSPFLKKMGYGLDFK